MKDAVSVHVTRWGNSGPTVLLVHGSAQGSALGGNRHFSGQECLAERGWQLVIPDRPGHGRSPAPGRPDDAEADGELVAELLGDGAHLVGHSFGGCVALAAAARRPSAVRSLTFIEPGMQKVALGAPEVRWFVLRLLATIVFSFSGAARAKRFSELVRVPPEVGGGLDAEELTRLGRALAKMRIPSKDTLERELAIVKRERIPLLVVTGGWSPAFEATADQVAALGGGRRRVISTPHHFPQHVSGEFNNLLASFMTESDTVKR
jgi:pimeloyl-ACP methyl ester carboxylesterase